MLTGELVISTGLFQTQCACRTLQELRRGEECPRCPTCGEDAEWVFRRGTYRQIPPPPAAEPGSTDLPRQQSS